ncbi:MAG: DUF3887 domain-containing protein [Cyanobacteriota bacterium]|jgi:hypothetical protein
MTLFSLPLSTLALGLSLLTLPVLGPSVPVVAQTPPAIPGVPVPNQALIERSERFMTLLNGGKADQAYRMLAQPLQNYWTPQSLTELWQTDFVQDAGSFQKVLDAQVIDVINAKIVKLTVQFGRRTQDVLFTFGPEQELAAISWSNRKTIPETVTELFQLLAEGNYGRVRGYFSPLIKTEILPERVETSWTRIVAANGAFKGVKNIDIQPSGIVNAPNVAIVTVEFAKGSQNFFIFFDPNRKIANVDFVRN